MWKAGDDFSDVVPFRETTYLKFLSKTLKDILVKSKFGVMEKISEVFAMKWNPPKQSGNQSLRIFRVSKTPEVQAHIPVIPIVIFLMAA